MFHTISLYSEISHVQIGSQIVNTEDSKPDDHIQSMPVHEIRNSKMA
jgi:hypothetical protein